MIRLLALCAALLLALPALAQTRHALVIGIDDYAHVEPLQKARNDARAVAAALETSGFEVSLLIDSSLSQLDTGLERFLREVRPGDDVLFFFAGHGVEVDGQNFLLPADLRRPEIGAAQFLRRNALEVDMIQQMIAARQPNTTLLILDACRDNPFPPDLGRNIGGTRGLARQSVASGSFVLMSADAGEAALDRLSENDPDPNSVFTRALLPRLTRPGATIRSIAPEVRAEVLQTAAQIGRHQFPHWDDRLQGDFVFLPPRTGAEAQVVTQPVTPTEPAPADPCAAAATVWASVETSESAEVLERFVEFYDTSCPIFAALAQERLNHLSAAPPRTRPDPVPGDAPVELTVVSWGGAYTRSQQLAYHAPFTRAFPQISISDVDDSPNALASLRQQARTGRTDWDLVDMLPYEARLACEEGLILQVDHDDVLAPAPDGTPPSRDFLPGSIGPGTIGACFIPTIAYSSVIAFRTDAFSGGARPNSIRDLFDVERFPGRRALQNGPQGNLEWALYADGVAPADIYRVLATPAGVDRAFAKLDTIRDHVVFWTAGAEAPQMLADGEVVMATGYNGRMWDAIEIEGLGAQIIWDGQIVEWDGWVVPSRGQNIETVMAYLWFATDAQRLADQAAHLPYGPARRSSIELVGDHAELGIDMAPHMPTAAQNFRNSIQHDTEFWSTHGEALRARFSDWRFN